jgi:pyruvate dehydrogenase E1 component
MVPFYIFYSMFGFQRVGDLTWAAGDSRARGFLIGGTSGRTTLNGEGLQHEDGHSHVLSSTVPNCVSYDPAYAYELAVIVHEGLRRMIGEQEDVYYYLTIMNENYRHPPLPDGAEEGILRGMHRVREIDGAKARLFGSGTILREVEAAAELLASDFQIPADVWSVTSYTELRREGLRHDRAARLHPDAEPEVPWITQCLEGSSAPVVAASDYMKAQPDGVRAWVPARFEVLGTDGFGRSDYRRHLRRFFEVDRHHVAVAALRALAAEGEVKASVVADAIARYDIDPDAPEPAGV